MMTKRNKWKRTGMSKHGGWGIILGWEDEILAWECPYCGNAWELSEGGTPAEHKFYFCPNCGARLIEEEETE